MKFWNYEGPFWNFLSTLVDLVWLNLLVIFTSIPIVTIGASFTALDYMCIKMWRGEDGALTKEYFAAFRANFKKSTLLWLVMLAVLAVIGADYYLYYMGAVRIPAPVMLFLTVFTIFFAIVAFMVFPFQAQFENTISGTFKNAILYTVSRLPKVLVMVLLQAFPFAASYVYPQVLPVLLFFAFSVPAYVDVILYNRDFMELGGIE